jgi:hypothetical protein
MEGTSAALNASTIFSDNTGFFQLVNYTSPLLQPWDLLDQNYLLSGSRKAFQLLAAQVAKSNLMAPESKTALGSYSTTERRLCFQGASFYAMESLFIVMILIAVTLSLLHRKSFVSRDIGSLAGISTIQSRRNEIGERHRSCFDVVAQKPSVRLRLCHFWYLQLPCADLPDFGCLRQCDATELNCLRRCHYHADEMMAAICFDILGSFTNMLCTGRAYCDVAGTSPQVSNRRWHCHCARNAIHTLRVDSITGCCIPWYRDPLLHVSNRP